MTDDKRYWGDREIDPAKVDWARRRVIERQLGFEGEWDAIAGLEFDLALQQAVFNAP